MRLTFLGATETVTGSRFLLEMGNRKVLVDCGLFQGMRELRRRNWNKFPIPPESIDAVILTHAHIDHSGYLPLLVKNGFRGKVYCSEATRELCGILLPDSGFLQEEEARLANRYGYSRHHPAEPLYTREDAEKCLLQFRVLEFGKRYKVGNDFGISLIPAGHILGASFVEIRFRGMQVLFSGDLGRPQDPIMYPPSIVRNTDYLILESTYGDKRHPEIDPLDQLADVIVKTADRKGTLIIPAFAVGRAQHMLYLLYQLRIAKRIPLLPIFLDSPMAKNATDIFRKHSALHRLDAVLSQKICDIATYVNTREESKAIDELETSKIIISASGMLEGGRVLHHIRAFASDPKNTIVFTGYQAAGTRGAEIIAGRKFIKIFGEPVPVNAEVKVLTNMSAHADYQEILDWLKHFEHPPRKVFITHGERHASESLQEKIQDVYRWNVIVPKFGQMEKL